MYHSLTSMFYDGVKKSFEGYITATSLGVVGDGSVLRPARAAIEILHSFGDHYKTGHDAAFTPIHIEALCPGYKLLANMADAGKHSAIDRNNPQISTASQITEAMRMTTLRDAQGLYINSEALVVVKIDDKNAVDVLSVMSRVINFWGKLLYEQGLMPFRYSHTYMGEQLVSRHLVRPQVELRATVGIPISVLIIPRTYDYDKQVFMNSPYASIS